MIAVPTARVASAKSLQATAERVLIVAGFGVLFFVLPHRLEGDDLVRYPDVQQLLNGHLSDSRFSIVMPLVSAPVVALGRVVMSQVWWATRFNVLVVATGAAIVWLVLRRSVDRAVLRRWLLVLLFASLLTNRLRTYDADVLTGTLFAIGISCIATRRFVSAGWAAIVVGAVNRPALVIALIPFVAYEAFRTKRLHPFAWLAAAALLVGVENWVRHGSPSNTGYASDHGYRTVLPYSGLPGFSFPLVLGVVSILFSFGRGLLFFVPGLGLWLGSQWRRAAAPERSLLVPMLFVVAGMVLVYAKWWSWYGGLTWGPRFFVFAAVPASLLLAVSIRNAGKSATADFVALAVLALSAWVGLTGAVPAHSEPLRCVQHHYALESLCWYVPSYSSLWWPILHPPAVSTRNLVLGLWCAAVFLLLSLPFVQSIVLAVRGRLPGREVLRGWRI